MAKVKITNLPKDLKITREEMRRACGGKLTALSGPVSLYGGYGLAPGTLYGMRQASPKTMDRLYGGLY